MKFSLDELQVESYASDLSDAELTEVKGGTTPVCVYLGITTAQAITAGVTIAVAGIAAWAATRDKTTTTVTYGNDGCGNWVKQDSTVTTENYYMWGN